MQRFVASLFFLVLASITNYGQALIPEPFPVRCYLTNSYGVPCYQIRTPVARYIFDVRGGGLTGILDRDGKDWISWNPTNGAIGSLRGLPNAGVAFGPGMTNSFSQEPRVMPEGATLVTQSPKTGMKAYWFFTPTNVQVTFLKAAANYSFVYAGTPAGKFDTNSNFQITALRGQQSITNVWHWDMPDLEWIAYGDKKSPRTLLLVNHTDDSASDFATPVDGAMQMFAFGKQFPCCDAYLTNTPARFSFGLVESTNTSVLHDMATRWSKAKPANW